MERIKIIDWKLILVYILLGLWYLFSDSSILKISVREGFNNVREDMDLIKKKLNI